jgi:exosome complex component RRP45
VSTGTLTLTLNAQRELCVLSKAGGTPLSVEELMKVVSIGVDVVREMTTEIETALKEDEKVRIVEVR